MSTQIGIIGLPRSGKTTIFNGLTRGKASTRGYSAKGLSSHVGVATVPDPRLDKLASLLHPRKLVPAEVQYTDIGASVKELAVDRGIGGQLLNQLSATDALINVVRAFVDDSIPHPQGSLNVERDIFAMNLELTFSDLAILERRLERIEISLKAAKPAERQAVQHEKDLLIKLKAEMEKDIPIREMKLTPEQVKAIANYQFLTAKPLLIVVNIGEDQLSQAKTMEADLNAQFSRSGCRVIAASGKLEMELSQLEDAAAQEFRTGFNITESGLDRVVKVSYELLEFISFFTTVSEEVRAWTIKSGTPALKAAGKIHTDMERGFIRAEVVHFDDLLKCGSMAEAKKLGLVRAEGKNYVVRDGDVITFLFNV